MATKLSQSIVKLYIFGNTIVRYYSSFVAKFRLLLLGAKVGGNFTVRGKLNLHISLHSTVFIGDNVKMFSGFAENPVGGSLKVGIWVNRNGNLIIRDGAGLSNATIVCSEKVVIGEMSYIGGGTSIYDTDFHSINPHIRLYEGDGQVKTSPVEIGKECFIGGHCIILKGVKIGDGAVIGAGSVVTKSVPPLEVWAGNPAKYIRHL